MPEIRNELSGDVPAVRALNLIAFPTEAEANLVDALRAEAQPLISLVASDGEAVVGHIMFTPTELSGSSSLNIMGLAPMAVAPDRQGHGIGSQLVSEGLERCKELGAGAVVVLGHPTYYPRFGFERASIKNIGCEYEVPDDVFMIVELVADYLPDTGGTIKYHAAFSRTG